MVLPTWFIISAIKRKIPHIVFLERGSTTCTHHIYFKIRRCNDDPNPNIQIVRQVATKSHAPVYSGQRKTKPGYGPRSIHEKRVATAKTYQIGSCDYEKRRKVTTERLSCHFLQRPGDGGSLSGSVVGLSGRTQVPVSRKQQDPR